MDREETVVDAVDRLERAVSRLERIVNGDVDMASPGLWAEHKQLMVDVAELKSRKPDPRSWLLGYVIFVIGMLPLIKEMRERMGVAPELAMVFMVVAIGVALMFFANGLGFIRWIR